MNSDEESKGVKELRSKTLLSKKGNPKEISMS
jgi:hypothetical protein